MTPQEALRHAYAADIARLPPELQGQYDPEAMANEYFSQGPGERHRALVDYSKRGHPDFVPDSDLDREIQDHGLQGYAGDVWTPEQRKAHGRQPEPYEFSPGGAMRNQIESRHRLYDALDQPAAPSVLAWGGPIDRAKMAEGHAKLYAGDTARTHNYLAGTGPGTMFPGIPAGGVQHELFNPENFFGTFTSKMSPVLSDGASQVATALLRGDDPTEGYGNAFVRANSADWYRTNPELAQDQGDWRKNNELVKQQREAYGNSQGMTSGDTFRQTIGNNLLPKSWEGRVPGIQPIINGLMSFGNGMADGSGALSATKIPSSIVAPAAKAISRLPVPGVAKFAASTYDDIAKHAMSHPNFTQKLGYLAQDEMFDVGNIAGTGMEFFGDNTPVPRAQWEENMKAQDESRRQSIRQLEANKDKIVRPPEYGVTGAIRKALTAPVTQAGMMSPGGFIPRFGK